MEETVARLSSHEDTVDDLKGDYQGVIEHTENMMIELDSFLSGSSCD